MKRRKKEIHKEVIMPPDSDDQFAFIAGYTEGGAAYGITWEEVQEQERMAGEIDGTDALRKPLELHPGNVEHFFAGFGIFVEAKSIKEGLSVYTRPDRIPLVRFRPTGHGDRVEVLWWSYRERWEQIGGVEMPLRDALQYVVDDGLGCFGFSIF